MIICAPRRRCPPRTAHSPPPPRGAAPPPPARLGCQPKVSRSLRICRVGSKGAQGRREPRPGRSICTRVQARGVLGAQSRGEELGRCGREWWGGGGAGQWRGAIPRLGASAPRGAVEDQRQQAAAARALAGSALAALCGLHGAAGSVDRRCQLAGWPGPFRPPAPTLSLYSPAACCLLRHSLPVRPSLPG